MNTTDGLVCVPRGAARHPDVVSASDQRQSLGFEWFHAPKAVNEEATTVEDLRGAARSGVRNGNFTLLYLWVSFRSNGGHACLAEMTSFFQGLQDLPDDDALVLVSVVEELKTTRGLRPQERDQACHEIADPTS